MDTKRKRIYMLDELRGFAILCMLVHHALLDVGDVLSLQWGYDAFDALCTVQPLFWAIFIIISGMCTRLSRSPIKRGAIVLCFGLVITLVTAVIMPLFDFAECEIYFGILHCLGSCMIITGLLMPLINKTDWRAGCIISLLLFAITYGITARTMLFGMIHLPDAWYQYRFLFPVGICASGFESADYFAIIPWIFMFLFGAFIGKFAKEESLPDFMYRQHSRFLCFVGRNSLWVYIIHQPVLYALFFLIAVFMA